jgi:hypothetical protein
MCLEKDQFDTQVPIMNLTIKYPCCCPPLHMCKYVLHILAKYDQDLKICDDGILIQLLNLLDINHCPVFYLKTFRRLDSGSVFR